MNTIKEARKNIALIWRRPKPQQAVYRPMNYLLKAQSEDGILLYNIVTSEMVLLDDCEEKIFESMPQMYSAELDELIAGHYLVPEDFEEDKSVRELRAILKKLDPPKRVNGFTILPTTDCNARCYYCFESDYERCTMTKQIADDVVDYIEKKCKGEPIQIEWFGGEPMFARGRIAQICKGLKKKNIKFRSSMVSNAYLFDENIIKTAKTEWNLGSIQITLDGTEEVYNKAKAYVNPKENPYRRVLRNIDCMLENGITVNIRLNVSDTDLSDLSALIDELSDKFGGNRLISCYSHAIYDGVGFEPLDYDDKKQEFIDSQIVILDGKLRQKGFLGSFTRLPYLRAIQCMADSDSTRLIYPDGTIGKCENKSSQEGIGNIYNDITDKERDSYYKSALQGKECLECCLYPYCINLLSCPETGRCSKTKINWKLDSYVTLMKEIYINQKQAALAKVPENSIQMECDS